MLHCGPSLEVQRSRSFLWTNPKSKGHRLTDGAMTLEWLPLLVQGSVTADWLADTSWLLTHACSLSHTRTCTRYCLRKKYYSEICNIVFSLFNSGQSILLLESSFLEEIERDRIISFLKKSKLQISIFQKLELKICYYILIVNWKENDSSILIFSWKRDKKNIAKFLI